MRKKTSFFSSREIIIIIIIIIITSYIYLSSCLFVVFNLSVYIHPIGASVVIPSPPADGALIARTTLPKTVKDAPLFSICNTSAPD